VAATAAPVAGRRSAAEGKDRPRLRAAEDVEELARILAGEEREEQHQQAAPPPIAMPPRAESCRAGLHLIALPFAAPSSLS
jgi:hypothetical protein